MADYQLDRHQSRAKWTEASTKIFADLFVEQIRLGNRVNTVLSKTAWIYIQDQFYKETGHNFDRKQLKNHLDVLRKRYSHIKALFEHDSFSWDSTNRVIVAEDDAWQIHLKAHPEVEYIKTNGCPIYEQLCIIFCESASDDKYSRPRSVKPAHHAHMLHDQSTAKWTLYLEKVFTKLVLEQVLQIYGSNGSFSKISWKLIQEEFNRKTGDKFEKQDLKNYYSGLRRLYNSIKWLLDQNGFKWDKSRCKVVAENEVWAKYTKKHPQLEAIKGKEYPLFEQLDKLFSVLNGDGGLGFSDKKPAGITIKIDVDSIPCDNLSKQDQSRAKWTASFDMIFVGLLIEQTQKASGSCKRAWKRISEEFNKRTGLKFDEQQLRNHQSILRKSYNSITSILSENGFSWNETEHKVVADDRVWNSYMKAHPEAEAVRGKEFAMYNQLRILFSGSETIEGKFAESSHDVEHDQEIISLSTPEVASISVEAVAEEAFSHSPEEGNISDSRNKRHINEPVDLHSCKRLTKSSTMIPHYGDMFSISNCINVLNGMRGIDEDLYLAASDLFQEHAKRETFISIKSQFRLAWLKAKCV